MRTARGITHEDFLAVAAGWDIEATADGTPEPAAAPAKWGMETPRQGIGTRIGERTLTVLFGQPP